MRLCKILFLPSLVLLIAAGPTEQLNQQKRDLVQAVTKNNSYTPKQVSDFEKILFANWEMTQGNPVATHHPVSKNECLAKIKAESSFLNQENVKICGANYMAPLYDTKKQKPTDASVCVDQFEFPNIPCAFPLVWVKAHEAHEICQALGKRLCDAQEWEDACGGVRDKPAYVWADNNLKLNDNAQVSAAHHRQRESINATSPKNWAYGPTENQSLCATGSGKSPGCDAVLDNPRGDVFNACGSNTYPAGYFSECKSAIGVYDLHGNAAEHMNLPLTPAQMTKNGGTGVVEMKGSWFVFQKIKAHPDHCYWRAPYWHGSPLMEKHSHSNYHLGFRCCKDVAR